MRAREFTTPTQQDLHDVAEWMGTTVDQLEVTKSVEPIDRFLNQIKEMYASYDEFPEDADRTNRIVQLIKQGEKPQPVYIEAGDPSLFVMEGRHRMVAFWLVGMEKIPVAYVSKKASELTEVRQGLLQFLKKHFPTWPDYVVYDFLYKQAKSLDNRKDLTNWVNGNKQEFGNIHWKLQNIKITFDAFDPETQRRMKERDMGSSNPYRVPKDAERHATQQAMIAKQGVSKEPIIVIKTPQGYELIEGWHRTIQHLKAFPEGYVGPAWVGS